MRERRERESDCVCVIYRERVKSDCVIFTKRKRRESDCFLTLDSQFVAFLYLSFAFCSFAFAFAFCFFCFLLSAFCFLLSGLSDLSGLSFFLVFLFWLALQDFLPFFLLNLFICIVSLGFSLYIFFAGWMDQLTTAAHIFSNRDRHQHHHHRVPIAFIVLFRRAHIAFYCFSIASPLLFSAFFIMCPLRNHCFLVLFHHTPIAFQCFSKRGVHCFL